MDTILIEKQLEKVSPLVKRIFFSTEVAEEIGKIGEDNGLLLDQINDLIEETGYMIIGLKSAGNFVDIISKKLKIDSKIARKISIEINDKVLKDVKEEIRKLNVEEPEAIPTNLPTKPSVVDIEKAGQFSIEKPAPVSFSPQYKEENINKEALLKSIEDKPVQKPITMIDHLLSTPVNIPEKTEIKKVEEKKIESKKPYTADPYREQF